MSCAGWTYSQLDRVLRPLRNRCNALATFSRRSPISLDDLPPLSILPPSDAVGFRIHLDKHHVKRLELSHRIYTVRDSFRTFLGKVLGNNTQRPPDRVITLADLCATIVGSRLEAESDHAVELFEAIPSQYQRKAVVAHALDLVLQLCPHNHTLLLLLLELTLAFELANESNTLLHATLAAACCPDVTTSSPPMCHPAHQTFLVDLCDRWTSFSQPTTVFVRILLSAVRTADVAPLWSCEAMSTFLIKLAQKDVTAYMSSLHLLSQMLSGADPPSTERELYGCLRLWLTTACTILLTHKENHSVDHVPVLLYHIALLLESYSQSQGSDDVMLEEIKNVSICLATHWLSRNRLESAQHQLRRVEHFLSEQTPLPTTFNALVVPIIASGDLQFVKDKVQGNARALRSRSWLQYEASLWACTLRQVESPKFEQMLLSSAGTKAVRDFLLRLIDQVEDAEKRCFGNQCRSTTSTRSLSPRGRKRSLEDSGEWDWDPTFRCWLRKQDRKKSRISMEPERCSMKLPCSRLRYSSEQLGEEREPGSLPEFVMLVSQAASKRVVLHREERDDYPAATTADPESDDILVSFYHDHD